MPRGLAVPTTIISQPPRSFRPAHENGHKLLGYPSPFLALENLVYDPRIIVRNPRVSLIPVLLPYRMRGRLGGRTSGAWSVAGAAQLVIVIGDFHGRASRARLITYH